MNQEKPTPTGGDEPPPARHLRVVRPPATDPTTDPTSGPARRHTLSALAPSVRTPPRIRPVQGTLPLLFVLPGGVPSTPAPPRALRLVRTQEPPDNGANTRRNTDTDSDTDVDLDTDLDEANPDPVPTPRAALPDPHRWTAALVQAAIETRHGIRPVSQLVRWTSREVYERLVREASTLRTAGARPGQGRSRRPVVRSLHLSEPDDGVIEACSVVYDGVRGRAVAVRIEGLDGRWVCTALDVL